MTGFALLNLVLAVEPWVHEAGDPALGIPSFGHTREVWLAALDELRMTETAARDMSSRLIREPGRQSGRMQ